jgi:hypothetical protein
MQALVLPSEKATVSIRFNLDGLLRGDYQSRMQGYSVGIQNGFYLGRTVQRLNELYSTNGQVGFICTQRVDGKVILAEGIQLLKMAMAG